MKSVLLFLNPQAFMARRCITGSFYKKKIAVSSTGGG
jgi:hypothetical protein